MAIDPHFDKVTCLLDFELEEGEVDNSEVFVDRSNANRVITLDDPAWIDTSQFKFGASSYQHSSQGMLFIGPPDENDAVNNMLSNDFTIEMFVRWQNSTEPAGQIALASHWDRGPAPDDLQWSLLYDPTVSGGPRLKAETTRNGSSIRTTTFDLTTEGNAGGSSDIIEAAWHHVGLERFGDKIFVFLDGVMCAVQYEHPAGAELFDGMATGVVLGGAIFKSGESIFVSHATYNAWFDQFRITKGVARYGGENYTVPTEAFPLVGPPPGAAGAAASIIGV